MKSSNEENLLLGRRGELLRDIRKARRGIRFPDLANAMNWDAVEEARTNLFRAEKELTEVDNELDGLERTPV